METIDKKIEPLSSLRVRKRGRNSNFSDEEKRLIVKVYLTNRKSLRQIAAEYGTTRTAIWNWCNKFAGVNSTPTHPRASHPGASAAGTAADANPTSNPKPPMPIKKTTPSTYKPEDFERLKQENERLKEQLEAANLMRHISEVMIDEAEKTFNIKIRKKSGTK